ncbi:uncharacterized protein LOC143432171 [Xylocopa sonorina]|uniref:uncharacterized protein LOC143432171 n=1 Tax=Xylocopa sonorina TaxID=1818115 RepID=UPI00403B30DF
MDGLLTGSDTIEEAQMLREQVVQLGKLGGFNLRHQAIDKQVCLDADSTKRTLGILWNSLEDRIGYQVRVEVGAKRVTKRVILSRVSQLFDPLGLLGPIVIRAKVLMQDLWKCNSDWDAPVPESILSRWQTYYNELPVLNHFSLPRKFLIDHAISRQLHGFCDASEAAYGACIYIRYTNQKGETIVRLLCAKSRVAPLKSTTLPRLELCAAHLLENLYTNVSKALKLPIESIKFWLDDWNYIATKENPADYISRGQRPSDLITKLRTVVLTSQIVETEFIHRFSSFTTLQRKTRLNGKLSITELQQAHACTMKKVQKQEFSNELHLLSKNQDIDKKRRRLRHSNINYSQKYPILLPKGHFITKLLIKREHINQLHAGILGTLNAVRQNYWPIDGKNTVRFIVRKCIRCFKVNPSFANYGMGSLPSQRLQVKKPFEITDYGLLRTVIR